MAIFGSLHDLKARMQGVRRRTRRLTPGHAKYLAMVQHWRRNETEPFRNGVRGLCPRTRRTRTVRAQFKGCPACSAPLGFRNTETCGSIFCHMIMDRRKQAAGATA